MDLDAPTVNLSPAFQQLFTLLKNAFPKEPLPRFRLLIYVRLLEDLDPPKLLQAVARLLAKARFFPQAAEIREEYFEGELDAPQASEAWCEVCSQIGAVGRYGKPHFENPLAQKAVQALGWTTLCDSEKIGIERAHFLRIYESLLKRAVDDLKAPLWAQTHRQKLRLQQGGAWIKDLLPPPQG